MRLLEAVEAMGSTTPVTTQSQETEIVVYCKVNDFDGLQKATHIEQHEQLESTFANGVRCRIRHTTAMNTQDAYVFTYKIPITTDGSDCHHEYNVDVDHDFYEGFRQIATHRLQKTRYEFASDHITLQYTTDGETHLIEVPDVKYEVDVYTDASGTVCEWCKIDIEIDGLVDYLAEHHSDLQDIKLNVRISHLSFEPTDMILSDAATEEQLAFIDSLWQ